MSSQHHCCISPALSSVGGLVSVGLAGGFVGIAASSGILIVAGAWAAAAAMAGATSIALAAFCPPSAL